MDLPVYLIYIVFFSSLAFCFSAFWEYEKIGGTINGEETIMITGFFCILIPLGMSLYNSYYSDFQAQGRYLLPALIPLMMMITSGYDTALDTAAKTSEKNRQNYNLPANHSFHTSLYDSVSDKLFRLSRSRMPDYFYRCPDSYRGSFPGTPAFLGYLSGVF